MSAYFSDFNRGLDIIVLSSVLGCSAQPVDTKQASSAGALDSIHWFASTPGWLRGAAIDRPELRINLHASNATVLAGDSVELIAVAHNSAASRIQVGRNCGPAMDVRITAPTGQVASAILLRISDPSRFAFTCELGPYHFADANDSLLNRYWWRAPRLSGTYQAVAGARFPEGLADESSTTTITVR